MSEEIATTVLKELREFRAENDKRWEENNQKLKDLSVRVTNLEKGRVEDREYLEQTRLEDRKYIEETREYFDKARVEDREYLEQTRLEDRKYLEEKRAKDKKYFEEIRTKDRKELMNVLDTMQKSIDRQFNEIKEEMAKRDERNVKEHMKFKKQMAILRKKDRFSQSKNSKTRKMERRL